MQYTIKLYPTVHSTTEGFRDISLEKRKCRFPNELLDGSKSMFKSYNQKGCIFECLMKKVTEQVRTRTYSDQAAFIKNIHQVGGPHNLTDCFLTESSHGPFYWNLTDQQSH